MYETWEVNGSPPALPQTSSQLLSGLDELGPQFLEGSLASSTYIT